MGQRKYTKESLEPVVKRNKSLASTLRDLGLKVSGGNHRLISQRIKEYNIDTSHFTGQSWSKGLTKENNISIRKVAIFNRIPDKEVFKKNSGYNPSGLRKRLVNIGWEEKCEKCNLIKWLNKPIRLHVDHINGDCSDHRLENLRFLCPNCHQQTKTWGNQLSDEQKKESQQRKKKNLQKKCKCGNLIRKTSKQCLTCKGEASEKINWPSKEKLKELVWKIPTVQLAKKLGVSDTSISNKCKALNIEKPPRGYWAKQFIKQ